MNVCYIVRTYVHMYVNVNVHVCDYGIYIYTYCTYCICWSQINLDEEVAYHMRETSPPNQTTDDISAVSIVYTLSTSPLS